MHCIRVFTIAITTSVCWAQGTTSLRGVISDQQDAVIAGAKVTLEAKGNGQLREVVTQQNGEYQFPQVVPGLYDLTVETPGFSTHKNQGLQLLVDTPATLNVKMEVASASSVVTVSEATAQLNTVNASVGNAFAEHQVQNLPLQTRNVVELLSLQPGVTPTGEVMGARRDQNTITLDGANVNDNQNSISGSTLYGSTNGNTNGFNAALPIPLDSVMEFRVTVAGQGASQARSSGGQVSLVTRSGSNTLHGSAYEYNRNTDFTANNWFNNRSGVARPQLVRNQFGAALGGPAKKDRIFYFLNYERRIDSSQQSVTRTVPSDSLRQGMVEFRTKDGALHTLSPADVAQVDPLHIGVSPTMLNILKQYPAGNAPQLGADLGLNFSGLIFNAPVQLDNRIYVGKFDWMVDARNTVSFRGTLSNSNQTNTPAQFPGQSAASELLNNSKGFAARYTAVPRSSLVNVLSVGLTRIGLDNTGASGDALVFGAIDTLQNYTRGSSRLAPAWNLADDINWSVGNHSVQGGINFLFPSNDRISFANSWPTYRFSRGLLAGLGQDIYNAAASFAGVPSSQLSNATAVTNGFGDVLGLINALSVTYQYQKDGSILPIGQPQGLSFITRNYEFYVQDTWKVSRNFTLTYGLRYSNDTPPFEASGLEVGTTPGIDQFFADRVLAQANGIPNNALAGARLSYNLNGPANGKPSWFQRDTNNFAPRLGFAYTPSGDGLTKWLGKNTVIRGGAAVVYDQYGSDLVANFASLGSVGLASTLGLPNSYNFSTSPRYAGGTLPALPAAPAGGFPYKPADIAAISGTFYGISPDLVAPYAYLLNLTASHEFSNGLVVEAGYVGRLSHKLLIQQDTYSPLLYFKDSKSGMNWVQADTALHQLYVSGLTFNQVKANPSLVPANPFVEDMFPALTNYYFPGSASANYFYGIYGVYAGSHLDNLHALDRVGAPNKCITVTGCWTFFAPQGSANPTWTNAANANFHGMTISVRQALRNGFSFDFNYTLSHSFDDGSAAADGAGQFGGVLQNAFLPKAFYGSSDFDIRQSANANLLYQLPVGKGKKLLGSAPAWVDEIVGGWQISSLIRYRSGLPYVIGGTGTFNTNYWQSSLAIPNGPAPATGSGFDQLGNPSIFRSTTAYQAYQDAYPGGAGTRAILRGPGFRNADMAVSKSFRLPWEGHSLQFRAEAFNAFNFVGFNLITRTTSNLSLTSLGTFGEFTSAADPRVMQLALRYSF